MNRTYSKALTLWLVQVHLRGENEFTALQSFRNGDGQAVIILLHEMLGEIVRPGSKIIIDYGRIALEVTDVVVGHPSQRQKRPSVPGSPSHQSMYQNSGSCSIKAKVVAADAVLKSNQVRASRQSAAFSSSAVESGDHGW